MKLLSGVATVVGSLLAVGCDSGLQESARKSIEADEARQANARQLVEAQLPEGVQASFRDVYSYHNRGAYVVCGSVAASGLEPETQRFLVKPDGELKLEGEASPLEFAREAEDLCRTYSDSDSDLTPSSTDVDMMTGD